MCERTVFFDFSFIDNFDYFELKELLLDFFDERYLLLKGCLYLVRIEELFFNDALSGVLALDEDAVVPMFAVNQVIVSETVGVKLRIVFDVQVILQIPLHYQLTCQNIPSCQYIFVVECNESVINYSGSNVGRSLLHANK